MKLLTIRLRVWVANKLIKLAHWIRPKDVNAWLESVQNAIMYGNGITTIDPKEFYKENL